MTTEWMKKHINPELLLRYEQALNELRGHTSSLDRVVASIEQSKQELEHNTANGEAAPR